MTMTEKQKMLAGELYRPGDPELQADQATAKAWMVRYNAALGETPAVRRDLLKELLGKYVDYEIVALEPAEFDAFVAFVDPGEAVLKALTQYEFILWTRERFTAFKARPERLENVDFEYQWDD